jgi:hypothetical protein
MNQLFAEPLEVIGLGLSGFSDTLAAVGCTVHHLDWTPPARGDSVAGSVLARLLADPRVDIANAKALAAYLDAQPVLVAVRPAREVIAGLADGRRLLHAGPPIAWADMCGPVQGAIAGAILFEGWAASVDAATAMAARGEIAFEPCHHHGAVGPMAGVISPSMPVFVVENRSGGNRAFSNLNEGLGKVLRFGANGPEVLERLAFMRDSLAPALAAALIATGPIELKPLMAQALHMGDEIHNRNVAASGLLIRRLAPALARLPAGAEALAFIAANDHFFLNLSMAACKAMLDAATGVPGSSMVTVMARNGVNFGIRLSGTGDRWFEAPANPVEGLFFPGYGVEDAAADLGDSAITETAGLGGFAMAASPAIVKFVGGSPADALAHSRAMQAITLARHPAFTLPTLDFAGSGAGIDARLVIDRNILPVINTGIAHRRAGIGQIGAGITTAPLAAFIDALTALADTLERSP